MRINPVGAAGRVVPVSEPLGAESPAEFVAEAVAEGLPIELADWIVTLCAVVLDGRNEHVGHGVQQALGRAPRDFRDFAVRAAAEGAWTTADAAGAR